MKLRLASLFLALTMVLTTGFATVSYGTEESAQPENINTDEAVADDEVDTDPVGEDDIDEGFDKGEEDDNAPVEEEDPEIDLAAPAEVRAKALGKSSIKITWNKVEGAEGYKVYCYSSASGSYKKIAQTEDTEYTHRKLDPDTRKVYKVAAFTRDGENEVVGAKSEKAAAVTDDNDDVTKLMEIGRSKLGCAYSAGSQGPNRFDCSGFVYYTFKKAGVGKKAVIRTSAQGQYASLKKYSIGKNVSKARVGDLVFFSYSGSTSGINHVGIYAGNGKVLHAGSYRTGVCYGKLSQLSRCGRKVCAIVRIL